MAQSHIPTRNDAPMTSIVAASRRIAATKIKRRGTLKAQDWQSEAWDLYDLVGELRFTANALAGNLSDARLFVARLTDEGEPVPLVDLDVGDDPTDDAESRPDLTAAEVAAIAALDNLGGGRPGRAMILERIALQLFVAGEGFILGLPPEDLRQDPDGEEPSMLDQRIAPVPEVSLSDMKWMTASIDEVERRGGKIVVYSEDKDEEGKEYDPDEIVLIRVWRPHPRKWWSPDSPVRSALPILRELVGLTKHVSANIDSRLAGAGLLIVPNSVAVAGSQKPEEQEADQDPFVSALIEAMITPIGDRDSASAVVPLVAKVPDDLVDAVKHIRFSTDFDSQAKDLRDEAIRRLALSLDVPPEVLLGLGDTNHWSAWQIEESSVQVHMKPVLALISDALTQDYLRPVLEEAGFRDEAEDFVIWYDTSGITARPNQSDAATTLYDRNELSGAALRQTAGFDEGDLPTEEEIIRRLLLTVAQEHPSTASEILRSLFPETLSRMGVSVPEISEPAPGSPATAGPGTDGEDVSDAQDRALPDEDTRAPEDDIAASAGNGQGRPDVIRETLG